MWYTNTLNAENEEDINAGISKPKILGHREWMTNEVPTIGIKANGSFSMGIKRRLRDRLKAPTGPLERQRDYISIFQYRYWIYIDITSILKLLRSLCPYLINIQA